MRTRVRNGQYTIREKSKHFSKKYEFFDDALPINEFYKLHSEILQELLRVSKIVCFLVSATDCSHCLRDYEHQDLPGSGAD
jgi:hypothetical protein